MNSCNQKFHMKKVMMVLATVMFLVASNRNGLHQQLQRLIKKHDLTAYDPGPVPDPAKVELGRMLFFDKILSGNKDISCATCHHPGLKSGDELTLSIGVGGEGLGTSRRMGDGRERIPRNSPEIFNRGAAEWHTMFWDGRVARSTSKGFDTPADEKLPQGLENVLAAQAMFPVLSRDEMRGEIGDKDILGNENELALISDAVPQSVWYRLTRRLLDIPEYRTMFQAVYPEIQPEKLGFQHAANAIAAFEAAAFTFTKSPWDRYLAGDHQALSPSAMRGAVLFYEKARCVTCHSGNLLTDQAYHNIGIPQFGPGKDDAAPLDAGRFMESGLQRDRFAFRTPPLRNVTITGPWMHNGAYNDLRDVITHHLNAETALRHYDEQQLPEELRHTYKGDQDVIERVLDNLDPVIGKSPKLSENEVSDILAFLEALTDPDALDLTSLMPEAVPSGLPLENISNKENTY